MKTDLMNIARSLDIKVFKIAWDTDVSGAINTTEEGVKIYLNESHCLERRRFTLAYELSHYILHKDILYKDILGNGIIHDQLYRSRLGNEVERKALVHTMDMLCPWHFINHYINNGITDIKDLAEKFCITNSTMSIRLGIPFEQ